MSLGLFRRDATRRLVEETARHKLPLSMFELSQRNQHVRLTSRGSHLLGFEMKNSSFELGLIRPQKLFDSHQTLTSQSAARML